MTKITKLRSKTQATLSLTQSREDVIINIRKMGDLLREKSDIQNVMNNDIAQRHEMAAKEIAPIDEALKTLEASIAAYCTVHRDELTDGGKVKFADLVTGKVYWRCNPPKVAIKGVDAVLALLEQDKELARFIRVKKEINKDAILNEAALFEQKKVPGISVVKDKEFFCIEPYNQELPTVL